ncbi:MAG: hypothetical protein ACRC2T_07730 [Thermoguttaceae bacterium]
MRRAKHLISLALAVGLCSTYVATSSAQYIPPMMNDNNQLQAIPAYIFVAPNGAMQVVPQNQATTTPGTTVVGKDGTPVQPQAADTTASAAQAPQGMVPHTVFYFPPPTFPEPIPMTIYRPAPQQYQIPQFQPQMQMQQQYMPLTPYPQMMSNQMYGDPMFVQPAHFGPQPMHQPCGLKGLCAPKQLGPPGMPIVTPPTLVYPNGIVVRPKVYIPNQPFKNVIRGITP